MPIEQRVISPKGKTSGSGKSGGKASEAQGGDDESVAGKSKLRKLLLPVAMILVGLLIAGAAYFLFLKPKPPVVEEPPQPGEVLVIERLSINLADGHYLRLGFSMQMTDDAGGGHGGEVDLSRAQDAAIGLFSGRSIDEVASPEGREALKAQLAADLAVIYHDTVMDVYLTDYVTQ